MGKVLKYSGEFQERAVRMVLEHRSEHASRWATLASNRRPRFRGSAYALALMELLAGTVQATPTINVNTNIVTRAAIPTTLYGVNVEWTFNADHINGAAGNSTAGSAVNWAGNTALTGVTWTPWSSTVQPQPPILPSATTLMKNYGVGIVRFPGGALADDYNWKNGVSQRSNASKPPSVSLEGPDRQNNLVVANYGDQGGYQNFVGTDDIVALSQAVGAAPPLFQIAYESPVGWSGSEFDLAADWVRYTNSAGDARRAANGHPAPYGIQYWEIGNEPYYVHGNSWKDQYVTDVATYSTAMKGVDPSIKIIAAATLDDGSFYSNGWAPTGTWNTALTNAIRNAGSGPLPFDLVAVHNTYAPSIGNSIPVDVWINSSSDLYQSMWALPIEMANQYQALESALAAAEGTTLSTLKTKIAVTEWGPLFSQNGVVSPGLAYYDFTKTMGSAIYVASQLATFIRDPNIQIATYFDLTSVGPMGLFADPYAANCWYGTLIRRGCGSPYNKAGRKIDGTHEGNSPATANDSYYMGKPSGSVFQLYHEHFGTKVVSSTISGTPATDPAMFYYYPQGVPPQGNLVSSNAAAKKFMLMPWSQIALPPAAPIPIPKLDVVSSLSDDGNTLYIMVINKSLSSDAPLTTTINLTGFYPAQAATAYKLSSSKTSPTLDDNNGVDIDFSAVASPAGQPPVGTNPVGVSITSASVTTDGSSFTYTFAPGTVTSIVLTRCCLQ
jgi:alpha-N-arabinofuranosidase